jgi:hypothetical protein
MEPKYRKIGLSIKATFTDGQESSTEDFSPEVKKAAPKKKVEETSAE